MLLYRRSCASGNAIFVPESQLDRNMLRKYGYNVSQDNSANSLPNYTRRIFWVFVGQMLLVLSSVFAGLTDLFPSRFCQAIALWALILSPLVYLAVLAKPIMSIAWKQLLWDIWSIVFAIIRGCGRLFSPMTFIKLVRFIATLKPVPTTNDGWITLCIMPFKTCVVATFPVIWIFEKALSYTSYYRPYGRVFGLSYDHIFEFYLISLLALLFGAAIQGLLCPTGRATVTLRFFLLGLVLGFFTAISSTI